MDFSTLGPTAGVVAVVAIFVKYLIPAINQLTDKVERSMAVDKELLTFLKRLNGSLQSAVQEKQKK